MEPLVSVSFTTYKESTMKTIAERKSWRKMTDMAA